MNGSTQVKHEGPDPIVIVDPSHRALCPAETLAPADHPVNQARQGGTLVFRRQRTRDLLLWPGYDRATRQWRTAAGCNSVPGWQRRGSSQGLRAAVATQ